MAVNTEQEYHEVRKSPSITRDHYTVRVPDKVIQVD
jgi:hypothetical protein